MTRLLIISHDVIGPQMAGPGIRYYQLACTLSPEFAVMLAAPTGSTRPPTCPPELNFFTYSHAEDPALTPHLASAEAILVPSVLLHALPPVLKSFVPLIIDGYNPILAEGLVRNVGTVSDFLSAQRQLTPAYLRGDFFICASERQRDWWLGLLEAHGRINPYTVGADLSLRNLLDLVPFGLPAEPPQAARPIIKGVWPGIEADSKVILWGGGLWTWLDPLSAIQAMAQVWQVRQDVRLIFPGTRHPNPAVAEVATHTEAAKALAQDLNLLDRAIFFGDWIAYQNWPAVLLESDVALSLHTNTLETRLSFRTRMLDYLWAGLPVITTEGDILSEVVAIHHLGQVVAEGDVEAISAAILQLLDEPPPEENFQAVRTHFTWTQAVQPLRRFLQQPHPAADRQAGHSPGLIHSAADLEQTITAQQAELDRLRQQNQHLYRLVQGYQNGRVMRFLAWVKRLIKRP